MPAHGQEPNPILEDSFSILNQPVPLNAAATIFQPKAPSLNQHSPEEVEVDVLNTAAYILEENPETTVGETQVNLQSIEADLLSRLRNLYFDQKYLETLQSIAAYPGLCFQFYPEEILFIKAECLKNLGYVDDAIKEYKLIGFNVESELYPWIILSKATCYRHLNKYQESLDINNLLKPNPTSPYYMSWNFGKAEAYRLLNQPANAIAHYLEARFPINSKDELKRLHMLAYSYVAMGDHQKAVNTLYQLMQSILPYHSRNSPSFLVTIVQNELAASLKLLNRFQEALEFYRVMIIYPQNPAYGSWLANMQECIDALQTAAPHAMNAVKKSQNLEKQVQDLKEIIEKKNSTIRIYKGRIEKHTIENFLLSLSLNDCHAEMTSLKKQLTELGLNPSIVENSSSPTKSTRSSNSRSLLTQFNLIKTSENQAKTQTIQVHSGALEDSTQAKVDQTMATACNSPTQRCSSILL